MHSQPIAHSLFECDQAQKTPYDKAKAERTHAFIEDTSFIQEAPNEPHGSNSYDDLLPGVVRFLTHGAKFKQIMT